MGHIPSATLADIQWQQPRDYELTQIIRAKLEQYWTTPKLQAIIDSSKIPELAQETEDLAKDVWDELAALRVEIMTWKRLGDYNAKVMELSRRNSRAVQDIMLQSFWNPTDNQQEWWNAG